MPSETKRAPSVMYNFPRHKLLLMRERDRSAAKEGCCVLIQVRPLLKEEIVPRVCGIGGKRLPSDCGPFVPSAFPPAIKPSDFWSLNRPFPGQAQLLSEPNQRKRSQSQSTRSPERSLGSDPECSLVSLSGARVWLRVARGFYWMKT